MDFMTILQPGAIKVLGSVSSKRRLFQSLGEVAASVYGISPNDAMDALQDRENLGPTGVGKGVALPHARMPGLTGVSAVFLRTETPIDFGSVDRQPVDLFFALFAPEEAGVEHLKALALVSRTMRDSGICAKLRANLDPTTLHTILTETLPSQAA
ncbi:PTS sugar transporter subunit IIA [Halocynthiibacter sp.]|uniref:PTS sugar transporter subunit IIA n=1 Tax=Halocynthiibacter sp. TaxID=1979210 RepID=UPI003C5CB4DA